MPAETKRRARRDAASKLLFTGAVIADLVRIRLPALAAALDLDAIEAVPTEYVDLDRSVRIGDAAFRVPRLDGDGAVFLSAEFQSRNARRMLKRTREYTVRLLAGVRRRKMIGPDEHPLAVCFVIHTGDGWTAADGTEAFKGLPPAAALEAAPYAQAAYILEDIGAGGPLPSGPEDNRYLAAARLVRRKAPKLLEQLEREWRRFAGDEHESFRRGMLAWVEEDVLSSAEAGLRVPTYEELEGLEDKQVTYLFKDKMKRFRAELEAKGKAKGEAIGEARGKTEERMLLLRDQAARKFGPDVAGRFAELLGSADAATQRAAGAWIIDCAAGDDLLGRLSAAARAR